ncbi:MAG: RnfABCDGE type electron transport complex subunit D [Thermoplasmata archaeon]
MGLDTTTPPPNRPRRRIHWPRFLKPARLLWIFLVALGVYGVYILQGLGLTELLVVPAVAVVVDLIFQRVRFPTLRFPDAALATGLFLALVLPPEASIPLASVAAFVAIALRHALRFEGRPWFNPAVAGIFVGAVILGLAPAWWIAVSPDGELAMIALGLILLARTPRSWRLPVTFIVAYSLFTIAQHLAVGATLDPRVLILEAIDPATLFFGLFMVTEPKTAPADPFFQAPYAIGIALGAAILPLAFPTIGLLLALLLINQIHVIARWRHARAQAAPKTVARKVPQSARRSRVPVKPNRWPVAYRAYTASLVVVVLFVAVASLAPAHSQPLVSGGATGGVPGGVSGGGGSGGGSGSGSTKTPLANCNQNNPSISSSTLSSLHHVLGPSVVLSYNSNSGLTVFYDPVNHVTVTETDLYEDYGFSDFNGDDYAVSGCVP